MIDIRYNVFLWDSQHKGKLIVDKSFCLFENPLIFLVHFLALFLAVSLVAIQGGDKAEDLCPVAGGKNCLVLFNARSFVVYPQVIKPGDAVYKAVYFPYRQDISHTGEEHLVAAGDINYGTAVKAAAQQKVVGGGASDILLNNALNVEHTLIAVYYCVSDIEHGFVPPTVPSSELYHFRSLKANGSNQQSFPKIKPGNLGQIAEKKQGF